MSIFVQCSLLSISSLDQRGRGVVCVEVSLATRVASLERRQLCLSNEESITIAFKVKLFTLLFVLRVGSV